MLLIHWPKKNSDDANWCDKMLDTWSAMEELYRDGRVRVIGLSNFLPHHIQPILDNGRIRPMVDQLELHVGYMQEYTLSYLKKEGILAQAWSPLGRARIMSDDSITKLAEKYNRSEAQIGLRWILQHGCGVIPKTVRIDKLLENSQIFDFELTDIEMSAIDSINEGYRVTSIPEDLQNFLL